LVRKRKRLGFKSSGEHEAIANYYNVAFRRLKQVSFCLLEKRGNITRYKSGRDKIVPLKNG
jgi:hypothetical protein